MDEKNLLIGIIGVGHLGEYHVQKYKAIPGVDVIGIVDVNMERAHAMAERYQTQAFSDHWEILDKVDAVSLAVPTEMHFSVAKDVLSKGVHLLIEKPITYELDPADILIEMAGERDLVLQVGLVERFNPSVVKMESVLTRPLFIESHRMHQFTPRGTDVDVVLDLMIHDLDIILHSVSSEVKEVHAVGMSVVTGKIDIANVRMIFENGTVANLTVSRVSDKNMRKIRVFQPDAYLHVDCLKREFSMTKLNGQPVESSPFPELTSKKVAFPNSDPLADQIAAFVDAVKTGSEPVVSGRDGRRALKYALGIIDQINSGCKTYEAIC